MKAEQARLKRLHRLERLRAIAKRQAALESAQAEDMLAKLQRLADRTEAIVASYASGHQPIDGAELQRLAGFVAGVRHVAAAATADASSARSVADGKLADLAEAERRRSAVEDRAEASRRRIEKGQQAIPLSARARIGTALE